jgi:hypothetical protein
MTKLILTITFIVSLSTIGMLANSIDNLTEVLAGTNSKSWYLYSSTPEANIASCKTSHPLSLDNTFTFYANGTYEFDHGAVTEDPACMSENCCSDLINISGTWKFTNNQTGLVITAVSEKGKPANVINMVIYSGTIEELSETVLKFSQLDAETNIMHHFELRKR